MIKDIINTAEDSPFKEVCGFVYYEDKQFKFQKAENFSKEMDFFEIHPKEFLDFKKNKNLVAIFHSHIDSPAEMSTYDIESCSNCLFPYLIFSLETEKFCFYYEDDSEPDLELIKKLEELINDY